MQNFKNLKTRKTNKVEINFRSKTWFIIFLVIALVAVVGIIAILTAISNSEEDIQPTSTPFIDPFYKNETNENEIIFNHFLVTMGVRYAGLPFDVTSRTFYREQEILIQDTNFTIMANEKPLLVELYVVREIVFGVFTTYVAEPYNKTETHVCYMLVTENFASCEIFVDNNS